ncbi:hypothetical protein BGAL_0468g00070 [Botrytis galanthina]|uniref:Uncharacterized protein n=1 Tax=Botrytis galanthina TaxID=278940 RepID=A0A4S8QVP0_9HELO|nr:hypothetical protein BGAL_0468g00070 [Botrytis galanthina]
MQKQTESKLLPCYVHVTNVRLLAAAPPSRAGPAIVSQQTEHHERRAPEATIERQLRGLYNVDMDG